MLMAWLLYGGILMCLLDLFRISAWPLLGLGLGFLYLLFFRGLDAFGGKKKGMMAAVTAAAILVLLLIFRKGVLDSLLAVVNQALDRVKQVHPYLYTEYATPLSAAEGGLGSAAFLAAGSFFLALLTWIWVRYANRILTGFTAVVFSLFLILSGMAPSVPYLLWLYGALAMTFIFGQEGSRAARRKISTVVPVVLGVLLASGILIGVCAAAVSGTGWKVQWMDQAASAAHRAVSEFRYGGADTGMPEGDFTELGSLQLSEEPALTVTMEQPDSYYLRGYVGEAYTGSGWTELNAEVLYSGSELFYWLHADGFFGQKQLAEAAQVSGKLKDGFSESSMTVRANGASREYIYAPYEFQSSEDDILDMRRIGDSALTSGGFRGKEEYSMEVSSNQVKNYPVIAAELEEKQNQDGAVDAYLDMEGYYNDYVYEAYTELSPDMKGLMESLLGSYEIPEGSAHCDYQEAKESILQWLTENITYSETLPAASAETDFLTSFLTGTKTGYSVHYATAAAEMFRYYGIPSRYVEGYLITPDDRDVMKAGQPYLLDGTHAHAWVEYYQDGVGWIPFEVTPAYMDIMEQGDGYQYTGSESGGNENQEDQTENNQTENETPVTDPPVTILQRMIQNILSFWWLLLIAVLALLLFLFIRRRRKTARRKELFNSPDCSLAIRTIFSYAADVLMAYGMKGKNQSLYKYETGIRKRFSPERGTDYHHLVELRQEAEYSSHTMNEVQRDEAREALEKLQMAVREQSNILKRFKYWAVDFL